MVTLCTVRVHRKAGIDVKALVDGACARALRLRDRIELEVPHLRRVARSTCESEVASLLVFLALILATFLL